MYFMEKMFYWAWHEAAGRPLPNPDWWMRQMEKDFSSNAVERKKTLSNRQQYAKEVEKYRRDRHLIEETGLDSKGKRHYRIQDAVCDTPDGGASVYKINDTFIELRTPFDEKRGFITLATIFALTIPIIGMPDAVMNSVPNLLAGIDIRSGDPLGFWGYLAESMGAFIPVAILAAVLYWGTCFIRLECFVQRRLLVRFNRKTRKVYVHRPRYLGGVVEFDWDKMLVDGVYPQGNEAGGIGMFLMLIWQPDDTPSGLTESIMVGRSARSNSEIVNLWEFVRRYMEEGPQAVPRPKLVGKFPWPWRSVQSTLSLVWPLFKMASLRWMIPLLVLISPAVLLVAVGNWISLLTCWEPRWPKAIRAACDGR